MADEIRSWGSYTNVPLTPGDEPIALPSPVVPATDPSGASASALRRVLRRARDGVALNIDEAAVAMTARGADLADLCASAARVRDAGLESAATPRRQRPAADQLFAQGLHPGHPPVPGQLPLLHLCHGAGQAARPGRGHVPRARRDPRHRPPRRRTRLQGSTFHARRPSRGSLAGGARVARSTRLRLHLVLRAGDGDPGAGGNRAVATHEPGRDELVGDVATQTRCAVNGHDAGDDVAAAVRDEGSGALWQPRQRPHGAAAGADRRRPVVDSVHHRSAGRHRRDAGRTCRYVARDSQVAQGVRARSGSDRAEFPGQGTHRDGRCAGRRDRRLRRDGGGRAAGARPGHAHPGAAQPGVPR